MYIYWSWMNSIDLKCNVSNVNILSWYNYSLLAVYSAIVLFSIGRHLYHVSMWHMALCTTKLSLSCENHIWNLSVKLRNWVFLVEKIIPFFPFKTHWITWKTHRFKAQGCYFWLLRRCFRVTWLWTCPATYFCIEVKQNNSLLVWVKGAGRGP